MNSARVLVSGNLALAPQAIERSAAPAASSCARLTLVSGSRPVRTLASERQLWAPDAVAARAAKPCGSASLIRCIALGTVLTVLACVIAFSFVSTRTAREQAIVAASSRIEVSVAPGDSLWSLAAAHPVKGLDTSRTVNLIREWNGLASGTLQVGEVLSVPAVS